jgi:prolyl oligopeptidase
MKAISLIILFSFITINQISSQQINYPNTHQDQTVDTYFGVKVPDPYRWLEDDNSPETHEWVQSQNVVTNSYLEAIPFREQIRGRLTQIWDYPKYGTPFREGKHYFFFKNDGLQAQSVLYIMDEPNGEARVFLDPNKLSDDGTVALSGTSFSNDGRYMAFSVSDAGSDWKLIHVMDVSTGEQLSDTLRWIKFSGMSWLGDGFYYTRYDAPKPGEALKGTNENPKIYFHKIGTSQKDDKLIFSDPKNPRNSYNMGVSEDETYLFLVSGKPGTKGNTLAFRHIKSPKPDFTPISDNYENSFGVVDNLGDMLIVRTNLDAPRYRLILVNAKSPAKSNWKVFIPESEDVIQGAAILGGKLFVTYLKDAASKVTVFDLNGKKLYDVELPGLGSIGGFSGKREDKVVFYSFTSFTFPNTIYKYDVEANKSEVFRRSEIDFKEDDYVTKQVFYTSKDGTKIPMFITHRRDINLDGSNPTLLYGYGGFNISQTPSFSISNLIFLENGGVYAVANLRGGGEYGEEWHRAGTLLQKQNVFDDFIAAAEYLIQEGYTTQAKLAIRGGSNGGLLVGACMAQRPELFKVALPAVGVMDMLRYHKFTIGYFWASDYGTSENEEQFHYLYKYSPLHNLKKGVKYPATLVTTADHDDRVVPAHSFKFAATLQAMHSGPNPVLIRIEERAGHGAGKPTRKVIDEATDMWSFVFWNLGMSPNQ